MAQFIHLLTNAGIGLPTDLWVPSTAAIRPQESQQVGVGITKKYGTAYEVSLQGYYKRMTNLIEYKDGASYLNLDSDWQENIASEGVGKSRGIEVFFQKNRGLITGWIGYTLSKTTRQFDLINFGEEFPYRYDRRHDLSVTMNRDFNERKGLSLVWVYGTGNAATIPIANFDRIRVNADEGNIAFSQLNYYGERNSFRMRSYHRLDLSFSWTKPKSWGSRKWTVALYNAYNRQNPFYLEFIRDFNSNSTGRKLAQISLFPILPSVAYSVKF
jgi:hypothetical protein